MTITWYLGADPGVTPGICLLGLTPSHTIVSWTVADATPRPRPSVRRSPAACDRQWGVALTQAIQALLAAQGTPILTAAVLEEPLDIVTAWAHTRRQGRPAGRGTEFRLGVAYGILLAAIAHAVPRSVPIVSYPVHAHRGRVGWMPTRTPRGLILQGLAELVRPWTREAPREDDLAALGVVCHHCRVTGVRVRPGSCAT